MQRGLLLGAGLVVVTVATTATAMAGGARATDTTIALKEYKIVMPAKLPAGQTTLTVKNTGKFPHNLVAVYRSTGASKIATPQIKPGESRTVTLNLKPGAYTFVCTVFNGFHAASGMVKTLQVGKIDFNTGAWGP